MLMTRAARKLGVPIYQLLGGKLRNKIRVYSWIGGDRPSEVEEQAYVILPCRDVQLSNTDTAPFQTGPEGAGLPYCKDERNRRHVLA
jgi:hypothetical protein